ncbi:type IX secretion system membrane protein PorP/SprF [Fulvivirgaceae bacterium BMA10]|uniref:Type IX secretion system membrane protein PorP/SprF n=1 Tax=Splendidivirga corallicola TaxID=3051826 RepID=A0ABT8KW47_9BACT|nr:type IX secretion system membrane protein PorP/SprF [Fulvivirgaceae bacterium BMA10]
MEHKPNRKNTTIFARYYIIVVLCFFTCIKTSNAQQLSHFSQYMFNGFAINPAYSGLNEVLNISLISRHQWTGIEGAPSTQLLSAHSLFKKKHIGLGIMAIHDRIGIHKSLTLLSSYAYHIQLRDKMKLSFGLQLGFNQQNSDLSQVTGQLINIANDPKLLGAQYSRLSPELGAGIYFKSEKLQLGFSVPKIAVNQVLDSDPLIEGFNETHYFLFISFFQDLNYNLAINPSALFKYVAGAPLAPDVNLNLIINDVLWLGTSFRPVESIDFITQMQLTPQLRLGYGYDFLLNDLADLRTGSHEILLSYLFKFTKSNVINPRRQHLKRRTK